MKKTKKYSVDISVFIAFLFLAVCVAAAFMLPGYLNAMAEPQDGSPAAGFAGVVVTLIMLPLLAILVCPMAIGAAVSAFSEGFSTFGLVTGAVFAVSLFLGLCVRVIKNVLEEAIAIKTENDLTV